jgi:hypothetical protein
MGVSDALAGKTVRCSRCGSPIYVAEAPGAAKPAAKPQNAGSSFYMSSGQITLLSVVAGLVLIGLIIYFGPVRVSREWDARETAARGTVMNLVTCSLKAYLAQTGDYDPTVPHHMPAVERSNVGFNAPTFHLTMPRKVGFAGASNQGMFEGLYDTQTGEIEANVWYGGLTVAGMVALRKPTGKFHLVGHEENGKPVVEVDGKKM